MELAPARRRDPCRVSTRLRRGVGVTGQYVFRWGVDHSTGHVIDVWDASFQVFQVLTIMHCGGSGSS